MKTTTFPSTPRRLTLRAFCSLNGLTVTVYERDANTRAWGREYNPTAAFRYWAAIDGLELVHEINENILVSPAGNGNTERSALAQLAKVISGKRARGYFTGEVPKLVGVG